MRVKSDVDERAARGEDHAIGVADVAAAGAFNDEGPARLLNVFQQFGALPHMQVDQARGDAAEAKEDAGGEENDAVVRRKTSRHGRQRVPGRRKATG